MTPCSCRATSLRRSSISPTTSSSSTKASSSQAVRSASCNRLPRWFGRTHRTVSRLILESAGGIVQRRDPETLIVRGLPIDDIGERAFDAGMAIHELSPHAGSLEELFLNWTNGDTRNDSGDPHEKGLQAMTWSRLIRAEIRKLTTTRMPGPS